MVPLLVFSPLFSSKHVSINKPDYLSKLKQQNNRVLV